MPTIKQRFRDWTIAKVRQRYEKYKAFLEEHDPTMQVDLGVVPLNYRDSIVPSELVREPSFGEVESGAASYMRCGLADMDRNALNQYIAELETDRGNFIDASQALARVGAISDTLAAFLRASFTTFQGYSADDGFCPMYIQSVLSSIAQAENPRHTHAWKYVCQCWREGWGLESTQLPAIVANALEDQLLDHPYHTVSPTLILQNT